MTNLARLPNNSPAPACLKTLTGKEAGTIFKILAREVTLGRGSDNDIPIEDMSCSRKHARISFNGNTYIIENISGKNQVLVNGKDIESSPLEIGDEILIGNTRFQFTVLPEQRNHLAAVPSERPQVVSPGGAPHPQSKKPKVPKARKKKLNPVKLTIYLALGGFIILLLQDPPKPKESEELRGSEALEAEIEAANKLREAAELEQRMGQKDTRAFREGQAAYIRGFRDYQQGLYGRASESFQACLSLVPNHALCIRYLRLSQRKFSELVQQNMILGREYRDQNQFAACASSFSSVMVAVRDSTSQIYKEAKANYEACRAQLEGRF